MFILLFTVEFISLAFIMYKCVSLHRMIWNLIIEKARKGSKMTYLFSEFG